MKTIVVIIFSLLASDFAFSGMLQNLKNTQVYYSQNYAGQDADQYIIRGEGAKKIWNRLGQTLNPLANPKIKTADGVQCTQTRREYFCTLLLTPLGVSR